MHAFFSLKYPSNECPLLNEGFEIFQSFIQYWNSFSFCHVQYWLAYKAIAYNKKCVYIGEVTSQRLLSSLHELIKAPIGMCWKRMTMIHAWKKIFARLMYHLTNGNMLHSKGSNSPKLHVLQFYDFQLFLLLFVGSSFCYFYLSATIYFLECPLLFSLNVRYFILLQKTLYYKKLNANW